jgi:hypothetical protein
MGDDPLIPAELIGGTNRGSSSASGNTNVFVSNFGKTGVTILVVCVGLSLGLAIGAVVLVAYSAGAERARVDDKIEAAEKRVNDIAWTAEREARIAQDEISRLRVELKINANEH